MHQLSGTGQARRPVLDPVGEDDATHTGGSQTLGRMDGGEWRVLRGIVETLRAQQESLAASATAALLPYLPAGRTLPPLEVRFHLGGTWDGRTTDAVYINLTLFQSRGPSNVVLPFFAKTSRPGTPVVGLIAALS